MDGINLSWRSTYDFPARITIRGGRDVNGLFGFVALLRKVLRELGGSVECMVVSDSEEGWTGRRADDPSYKEHRESADFSPIDALLGVQRALTHLKID